MGVTGPAARVEWLSPYHAAALHLDTPFSGFKQVAPDLAEYLGRDEWDGLQAFRRIEADHSGHGWSYARGARLNSTPVAWLAFQLAVRQAPLATRDRATGERRPIWRDGDRVSDVAFGARLSAGHTVSFPLATLRLTPKNASLRNGPPAKS